jgi:signal transduction histidine kinase
LPCRRTMSRLPPFEKRECPAPRSRPAWETQRESKKLCFGTTPVRASHVVDYKALSRTTSPRKRVRNTSTPAAKTRPGSTEALSNLLARELHDGVAQTLSAMLLDLANFRVEQYGRAGVLKQVDLLEQSTRKALADLRALLVELRSQQFTEEDLVTLVRRGLLERQGRARGVEFGLQVAPEWPDRLAAPAAMELYRVIAEAVDNGVRHGEARKIQVTLAVGLGDRLGVITITDDGRGLPKNAGVHDRAGLGILGMRERASLLNGDVTLERGPDGRGTSVVVTVPLVGLGRPETKA